MNLPRVSNPNSYVGYYVIDFGSQVAMGYTASEVTALLESEKYQDVTVYRIVRAQPDGTVDLVAVSINRFHMENIFLFASRLDSLARKDFADLCDLTEAHALPARAALQFANWPGSEIQMFGVAMIYPAEFENEMSKYLSAHQYNGGEVVECGPTVLQRYRQRATVMQREQRWGTDEFKSRPVPQLLAEISRPLQREIA